MIKILSYKFNCRTILKCPINNFIQCSNSKSNKFPKQYYVWTKDADFMLSNRSSVSILKSHINLSNQLSFSIFNKPHILDQEKEKSKKVYQVNESALHHKFLEESSIYSSTLYKNDKGFIDKYNISNEEFDNLSSQKDWAIKSPSEVAEAFISLGLFSGLGPNLTMDEERFNDLIDAFEHKCSSFTDEQLFDCLISISLWPKSNSVKATNFYKVWKALDKACLNRCLDWTIDKLLYVIDLWYQQKLIKLSDFVYKSMDKISRKCSDLTRAQMIQAFFYLSCLRQHPGVSMREYEHYLQKHITHLTIEEIGIVAVAFFKTKTSILNRKVLLYIMQRVVKDMDVIAEVTLTAVAKTIRLSHPPEMGLTANDLVEKITMQKMKSLNLLCSIHVAHINTKLQFFNEETINLVAEKFYNNPNDARLKDIERVAFFLSLYNYIPPTTPDILDLIQQKLESLEHMDAAKFHRLTQISLVFFLTLMQRYPEKVIRQMLSPEFIKNTFDTPYAIPVQLLQIDCNRVLEGPKGSEHLLSPSLREKIARRNSLFPPNIKLGKINKFDQMMLDIMNTSKKVLGGEENYLIAYTLPHFPRVDIIFQLDNEGRPVPIPNEMRSKPLFEDVMRPIGDNNWYCVIVANRNMYMHNVPRLAGDTQVKIRQLRLLGYTPILIPEHYWLAEKNKVEYLKLKYFNKNR